MRMVNANTTGFNMKTIGKKEKGAGKKQLDERQSLRKSEWQEQILSVIQEGRKFNAL